MSSVHVDLLPPPAPPAVPHPGAALHRLSTGTGTRPRRGSAPLPARRSAPPDRLARLWVWPGWTVVVTLVALAVVGYVHARGMYTAPIRFDDEGTYVSQADSLLRHGRLAPYTYWYDHPPLGWMVLAGWSGTVGAVLHAPNMIGTGRQLMLVLDLVSVVLVVLLAHRVGLPRWAALAAALVYGLDPLALTYHRMVLLDNIATPLLLGAFLLALSPGRRLSCALGSGLLLAGAVLVKETTLLMLPFVLWALWRGFAGPTRRMCLAVFALGLALPSLLYPLFALTRGELLPGAGHVSLWQGVFFQLLGRQSSGSVFDPTSDASAVVHGWLSTDPYLPVAACALVLPALLVRRLRPLAGALLFSVVAVLRPGYLPVPYVVALVPLGAIVVAGVPGTLWTAFGRRLADRRRVVLSAAVSGLVGIVVAVVAAVQVVSPHWYYRDASLMRTDFDRPYTDATRWLEAHVPRSATLLVDNVTWTSLIDQGWSQDSLVWFTKPDADADVDARIRNWHDIDYVVSSDIMRTSRQNGGTVKDAIKNSRPVATWGSGSTLVEVRQVAP